MNTSKVNSSHDASGRDFRRLISAWCDGAIGDAEHTQLQAKLVESRDARQMFLAYMSIHSGIHDQTAAHQYLESMLAFAPPADSESDQTMRCNRSRFARMVSDRYLATLFGNALAATLLLGFVGWWVIQTRVTGRVSESTGLVARVVEHTDDCQWFIDRGATEKSPSEGVRGGETIRVTTGRLKLAYENGTLVTLHSPALYQVLTAMQARVWFGKLTADVAKGGEGFSVLTPRATVIDLGTAFGIEVSDMGATDVVVFEGAVDLAFAGPDKDSSRQQRLHMGEGMHVDSLGTASRIVSITNDQFSYELDAPSADDAHPIVVSSVHDNVQRNESWNYYEIVHAGMREDAMAYVDRKAHQYNGVDKSGMPRYLIGGDYVKTFNNDKVNREIRIDVSIAVPARLYVLLDKRLSAPPWLQEEFTDTGDVIGIDTGPFYSKEHWWNTENPPGVGPGVSVEDTLAIWVREVPEPGVVHLGSNEAPESGPNMYGIVAVPLEQTR